MKTGVGLRSNHYSQVLSRGQSAPWFELITENFMGYAGRPELVLNAVRENHPIAFHGLGLSIGSLSNPKTDKIRLNYLAKLKGLVDRYEPFIVSDHLSWSYLNDINSHDLLPIPYTHFHLRQIIDRVDLVQNYLNRKITLENPSHYVTSAKNEMRESEFLRQLCQHTGCGILLDLNNLLVNKNNLAFDIDVYLDDIRLARVEQFHLAGHTIQGELCIDTHLGPPNTEQLHLLQKAVSLWPNASPLLEWDTDTPSLDELLKVANTIDASLSHTSQVFGQIMASSSVSASAYRSDSKRSNYTKSEMNEKPQDSNLFYSSLWHHIFSPKGVQNLSPNGAQDIFTSAVPVAKGLAVYNTGYFIRAFEALKNLFPKTSFICQDFFEEIARQYLSQYFSKEVSIDKIGDGLPDFLSTQDYSNELGVSQTALSEFAELERVRSELLVAPTPSSLSIEQLKGLSPTDWENSRFQMTSALRLMHTVYAVEKVFEDISLYLIAQSEGAFPSPPQLAPSHTTLLLYRHQLSVAQLRVSADHVALLRFFENDRSMIEFLMESQFSPEGAFQFIAQYRDLLTLKNVDYGEFRLHESKEIGF